MGSLPNLITRLGSEVNGHEWRGSDWVPLIVQVQYQGPVVNIGLGCSEDSLSPIRNPSLVSLGILLLRKRSNGSSIENSKCLPDSCVLE
jgi:hypothetical protein